MIAASSIAETRAIPPAPAGWFDYKYAALIDGRLALIRTRRDVHAEYRLWSKAVREGASLPAPDVWEDVLRLSVFDGESETNVVAVASGWSPIVDRTADGRWLIASALVGEDKPNARICSADGAEEHSFAIGDCIQTLCCAPDGTIWVGYFDEGIFARAKKDGSPRVSSGGIVRFGADGKPCWSFNDHLQELGICDCDAMTLTGDVAWACYYTDYPIVRVEQGEITSWANDICGASAMAVKDDAVLLAGGYGEHAGRIAVLRLEGEAARRIGHLSFAPPPARRARLAQGRDGTLHLVADGVWSKIAVDRAVQALG
jgi:hypothetical protein